MNNISTIEVGGKLHREFPKYPSQLITIDTLNVSDIMSSHPVYYIHSSGEDLRELGFVLRQKLLFACVYRDDDAYPAGLPIFIFFDGKSGVEFFVAPLGWHEEAMMGWMRAFYQSPALVELGFERINSKNIHPGHVNLFKFICHDFIKDRIVTIRDVYPPFGFILELHRVWSRDPNIHRQSPFYYEKLIRENDVMDLIKASKVWSMSTGEEVDPKTLFR